MQRRFTRLLFAFVLVLSAAASLPLLAAPATAQRKLPPILTLGQHRASTTATCNIGIVVDCTNGNCSSVTTNIGTTSCSGLFAIGYFTESTGVTLSGFTNNFGMTDCFDSSLYPEIGFPFAMCMGMGTLGPGASFTTGIKISGGNADLLGFTEVLDPATYDEIALAYAYANATQATCTPVLSTPTNVTSDVTYTATWTASSSGSSYQIDEATTSDFANATSKTVTGTSTTFKHSVTANTTYYYRVRSTSCSGGAPGPYSNIASTLVVAPAAPTANTRTYDTVTQYGSTDPVGQKVFIKYPGSAKTGTLGDPTFTASTDKGNTTVTPSSGTIPPGGTTVTVVTNPTNLPPGANTATLTVTPSSGATQTTPVSVSLVTPVASGGKSLPPSNALIVPVVTHVNGAGGTFFSDVRLTNTSGSPISYQVTFTPTASNGTQTGKITNITVSGLQTIALNDIAKDFFGYGASGDANDFGFGALEIRPLKTSSLATYASSRTYFGTTQGTFGQFIAAIPFSQFVSAMALIPGPGAPVGPPPPMSLQQVAQSSKFRTNLGLVEGSGTAANGKINIYDDNGTLLKSVPYTLQPGEQKQMNAFIANNAGIASLEDGRIEITVDSATGAVSAYASVLDNKTSDPLCVMPVQAANVAATRYAVPGIAEFTSAVSNFHSDMRIYNGGSSSATVTLTYYPQGNGTPVAAAPFTLGKGQVKAIDNVLPSFFNVASGGGSVVATTATNSSLVLTGRTYSLDSTTGGTYGQFIPGVSPNSGSIGVGSTPLQILQLEQSSQFRSNVGLVETAGSPAHVKLTLVQPDTTVSANAEVDLAANEFRQLGSIIQTAFGVNGAVYNARVIVQVTSGSGKVAAYGSVIDNATSDPTYVPAQ